ncbi:MAG: RidA family protein [bacterium]|nr:RidA family protein [bacterium]
MKKEALHTDNAPGAVGPYSQGIKSGNLVFVSGQLGMDPATKVIPEGVEAQARQVFKNLEAILKEAGAKLDDIVKATVFLKDMADFQKVNAIYAEHFTPPYPARAAMAVKELPLSVDVEIEAIASI